MKCQHTLGFKPTVVEKAPALRPGGYPIDLRGVAVEVVRRMELLDIMRKAHIATRRITSLDSAGRPRAVLSLDTLQGLQ